MQKIGIHTLSLVFCPLSNQECEWMWCDKDVRAIVQRSKLYMIGQRREVKYENFVSDPESLILSFDIVCGHEAVRNVSLSIRQFNIPPGDDYILELGSRCIRISRISPNGKAEEAEVVHWFTPDRLFMYHKRGKIDVQGLEDFRRFSEFDLYYVGISKEGDSFSRLFKTAHEKRSRILGNETQFNPTSRLTDELMVFLFDIEDLQITSYRPEDIEKYWLNNTKPLSPAVLAADAEKAFIKILRAKYNAQTYKSYPKSSDGLWGHGFERYGFLINDSITFKTPTAQIRGAHFFDLNPHDAPDLIAVEGNTVRLISPDASTGNQ